MNLRVLVLLCVVSGVWADYLPVVLWHGMGDSCCFPFSLGSFKKQLEEELPGVYVLSLKIGGDLADDLKSGYFTHPNKQLEEACEIVKSDEKLQAGFNAIGFSQGSQFLRALKQRCNDGPQMLNLISLGGQHQGIFGLPNCPSLSSWTCEKLRQFLNVGAYTSVIQNYLVQATYWHDPLNEEEFRKYSTFLADINNENEVNEDYKHNLLDLKRLVLVKFLNDTIVQPRESQWFGFYKPGQDKEIAALEDTDLYKEDRLGLRTLKEQGRLVLLASEGNHLRFTKEWFQSNILPILKE